MPKKTILTQGAVHNFVASESKEQTPADEIRLKLVELWKIVTTLLGLRGIEKKKAEEPISLDWYALEATGGVSFDEGQRAEIVKAANHLLRSKSVQKGPSEGELKKYAKKLATTLEKGADLISPSAPSATEKTGDPSAPFRDEKKGIEQWQQEVEDWQKRCGLAVAVVSEILGDGTGGIVPGTPSEDPILEAGPAPSPEDLANLLGLLAVRARLFAKNIPVTRGRKRKVYPEVNLAASLHAIWKRAGGKGRGVAIRPTAVPGYSEAYGGEPSGPFLLCYFQLLQQIKVPVTLDTAYNNIREALGSPTE